jgi:hypothetical protein
MTPISATAASTIASIDLVNGDDPAVVLSMLSEARSAARLKSLRASIDGTANQLSELRSISDLLNNLGRCIVGRDGNVVIGDISADQLLRGPTPMLASQVTDAAAQAGISLPTQKCVVEVLTSYDSKGKVLWSSNGFATSDDVAAIRAGYTQTGSGAIDEYTKTNKANGVTETWKVQLYNQQGFLVANKTDLANLKSQVDAQIGRLTKQMQSNFEQLGEIVSDNLDKAALAARDTRIIRHVEDETNARKRQAMDALSGPA